jgi:Zn-dependent protease with chaperone function
MKRNVRVGLGTLAAIAACMVAPASGMNGVGHPVLLIGLLAIVVGLVAVAREAWRHQQLAASIARLSSPTVIDGRPVGLVPGLGAAVVACLQRPRIYCADDLPQRLDADELRAVILHEHHHQLERGPVRLVLIGALAPLLGRLEAGRAWMERERARLEIAADAYALESGASRPALASALVKLASTPGMIPAPGFASAADLRVRALLGEPTGTDSGSSGQIATAIVLIASCVAIYLK